LIELTIFRTGGVVMAPSSFMAGASDTPTFARCGPR
jgi:hypothetical protein